MSKVTIVSPRRLSNYYVKKYNLTNEKPVTLNDQNIICNKVKPKKGNVIKLYSYHANVNNKKDENRLKKGDIVTVNGENAYLFNSKKRWIIMLLLLALILFLMFWPSGKEEGKKFNIIGDEKAEIEKDKQDNIVYQGFTSEFDINEKVKTLSIQNSEENEGKYYVGVSLKEGETEIYSMGEDLIKPGKYVNIDLYDLLDEGSHEITIVQYGYMVGEKVSSVSTRTQQTVTVNVSK